MGAVRKIEKEIACKHLRRREPRHGQCQRVDGEAHDGVFWCDATRDVLGPDGDEIEDGECTEARTCFEEDKTEED